MNCFECAPGRVTPALASCRQCGVALCGEHAVVRDVTSDHFNGMTAAVAVTTRTVTCTSCAPEAALARIPAQTRG